MKTLANFFKELNQCGAGPKWMSAVRVVLAVIVFLAPVIASLKVYEVLALDNVLFTNTGTDGSEFQKALSTYNDGGGQTFTTTNACTVTSVTIRGKYTTGNSHTAVIAIYPTSGGYPTGSPLWSDTISTSSWTTDWDDYNYAVTPSLQLSASTVYALTLIINPDANSGGLNWSNEPTISDFSGGKSIVRNFDTGVWSDATPGTRDRMFTIYGLNLPSVTTNAATSVTNSSAVLNGNLTDMGAETTLYAYFGWNETGGPTYYTPFEALTTTGTFNTTLTLLEPAKTYNFWAIVNNGTTAYYGSTLTVTTSSSASPFDDPVVQTLAATNYSTGAGATLNGNLSYMGIYDEVYVTFQMRRAGQTEADWVTFTNLDGNKNTTGNYSVDILSLQNNTWYQYRAVADSGNNTYYGEPYSYGDIVSFLTGSGDTPVYFVTSMLPVAVAGTNATFTARIDGGDLTANDTVSALFGYNIYANGDTGVTYTTEVSRTGPGTVSVTVTGLTPNTQYKAKAYGIKSSNGLVVDSAWISFVTGDAISPTPTPTSSTAPTGSPIPIGPVNIPSSWNTTLGRYLLLIILMVVCPVVLIYVFGSNIVGKALGGTVDCIIFTAGTIAGWIDLWILVLAMIVAGYIIWKVVFSPRGA